MIDKKTGRDKGWDCDLVPKVLIVARYFGREAAEIVALQAEQERVSAEITSLEEEHGSDDGLLAEFVDEGELTITDKLVKARIKEIKGDKQLAG